MDEWSIGVQDDGVLGCGAGVPGLPLSGAIGAADEADFGCCRTRGHSRCVPAAQERQTPNAECERERGCARPCGTWLVYSILVIRLTWPFLLRALLHPAVFQQSSSSLRDPAQPSLTTELATQLCHHEQTQPTLLYHAANGNHGKSNSSTRIQLPASQPSTTDQRPARLHPPIPLFQTTNIPSPKP